AGEAAPATLECLLVESGRLLAPGGAQTFGRRARLRGVPPHIRSAPSDLLAGVGAPNTLALWVPIGKNMGLGCKARDGGEGEAGDSSPPSMPGHRRQQRACGAQAATNSQRGTAERRGGESRDASPTPRQTTTSRQSEAKQKKNTILS
ncbi:hypothetical protein DQ04_00901180, partial [Trypanosoma grayi]|uniref:hypothetical protein n=1 Tax=Trypanosoma grayi TaxID=71804 RepID=UPI0004F3F755